MIAHVDYSSPLEQGGIEFVIGDRDNIYFDDVVVTTTK